MGGYKLFATFQIHVKQSIRITEKWFVLIERTTQGVLCKFIV